MEQIPTRNEMIEMAVETRKQVTSAVVSLDEMERYPAVIKKLYIPTSVGDSEVYLAQKREMEEDKSIPLIINFHGGGFIKKRTENDELYCRKLLNEVCCKVMDVDYRVAPEHPFPCGLTECYEVVKWAFEHSEELNIDKNKIILSGHSAGGNFICGICILLERNKEAKPLGVVIDYPPMDLLTDVTQKEQRGKGIPPERARLYNLYYCEEEQHGNPLVSPLLASESDLNNFPQALFITAGEDTLCNECEEFALKLTRGGNVITLKRFENAGHGFTIYRMDQHEEAMKLITEFIKRIL